MAFLRNAQVFVFDLEKLYCIWDILFFYTTFTINSFFTMEKIYLDLSKGLCHAGLPWNFYLQCIFKVYGSSCENFLNYYWDYQPSFYRGIRGSDNNALAAYAFYSYTTHFLCHLDLKFIQQQCIEHSGCIHCHFLGTLEY